MKPQKTTHNKKRSFVWILTILMFVGLLDLADLDLADMSLAAGDKWVRKANMLGATWAIADAVVDGKVYCVTATTLQVYDPVADKWTSKAPMPTQRLRHAACAVNGKIYAIGGAPGNFTTVVLATVEEYDPATNTWTKKSDMPTARHSLSLSVVDGKIYAIGGGKGSVGGKSATALDPGPVEVYDPATDTWVKKPNMPTPRFAHAAGVVRGKTYLVGGNISRDVAVSAVSEYDPTTGTWQEKAAIPTTRYTLTASVVNNKIYAIGGATIVPGGWTKHSDNEEYDPTTDTWTKKTPMPIGATDVASGVVDGKIYVTGGWLGGASNRGWVDEYTPEDWPFMPVSPQGKLVATWGEMKLGR